MDVIANTKATAEIMSGLIAQLDPQVHPPLPTPCEGWQARDLVGHICENPLSFLTWAGADATPVEGDHPSKRYGPVMERLIEAYSAPGVLDRALPTPFGDLPGSAVLAVCFADQLTHVWDLHRTTGFDVDVDEALAEDAIVVWQGFITDALRDGRTFADPVTPPADATALERLAALTGRQVR